MTTETMNGPASEAAASPAIWLWNNGEMPSAVGDGFRPWLEAYPLPGGAPRGAIVVCPGGGYSHRADHEGEPIARWLNTLGLAAFVVQYRVSPSRYPAPLQDVRRAIRLVRSLAREWNVNPRRVGVLGFSAGGHLAISAATLFGLPLPGDTDPLGRESARPDALVACYPVVTFQGPHAHEGSAKNLLGPDALEGLKAELSLEKRVTSRTPPAFIWHTADDGAVPVENSRMLAGALHRCQVPHELHIFPHGRHGLGLGETGTDVARWPDLCAGWFRALGWIGNSDETGLAKVGEVKG